MKTEASHVSSWGIWKLWKIRGNDSENFFPAQIVVSVLVMTPAALAWIRTIPLRLSRLLLPGREVTRVLASATWFGQGSAFAMVTRRDSPTFQCGAPRQFSPGA